METITELKFKQVELGYMPAWVTGFGVGEYKVVQYGKSWFAFVHAPIHNNWGNSCFYTPMGKSVEYATRKEAQKAAIKHHNHTLSGDLVKVGGR